MDGLKSFGYQDGWLNVLGIKELMVNVLGITKWTIDGLKASSR